MSDEKSTVLASLSVVCGNKTPFTSIKLSTQNHLLWVNAIYIILESTEKVDIEYDPPAEIDKAYPTWQKNNGLGKAWLWSNMELHIAACFMFDLTTK